MTLSEKPKDLTDALLLAQKEAEEADSANKDLLTDTHVLLIIFDVFGGW